MSSLIDKCVYRPDRGIDYYTAGIATLLGLVRGNRPEASSHTYVKEVRRALETLLFGVWDRSDEYISVIASSFVPDDVPDVISQSGAVYVEGARKCFRELLAGMLKRFHETTQNIPVGMRIKLMNIIVAAIDEMARYDKDILSKFFFESQTPLQNKPLDTRGGTRV